MQVTLNMWTSEHDTQSGWCSKCLSHKIAGELGIPIWKVADYMIGLSD